ncbi:MAG: tyrosine-type recombinase/integrase [Oscillospiraceae bacterium]|nr:tyrosine-type recombinase/integrase [Oscillospiraceae bacterium]
MRKITNELIESFKEYLIEEEKSENTIEKYIRDITFFMAWLCGQEVTKILVLEYKKELCEKYAPASVNAAISSLNSFFAFMEWHDIRIKALKIQRQIFSSKEKELTKAEYERLLNAAKSKKNERLYYLMQTICSTGIRVSEVRYITISAVHSGQAIINCKGKMRIVILPKELCKMLKGYIRENNIKSGSVFVSRTGKPLDRSHIWKMLKALCETAGVSKDKVFPHNFRHLFARTYYSLQKDIVRLADILGHSSVNTTRIYTIETGEIHRRQIQKLGLLRC